MASFEKYYYNSSTINSQVETALPCANHTTVCHDLIKEYDSSNLCWYTPVLPGIFEIPSTDNWNPWEKPYYVPIYVYGEEIQLAFLTKRTYFAPSGSTPDDLWGTYSWYTTSADYAEIYLLHKSGNTYDICSSVTSNTGSYTPGTILKEFTPVTDRIAVFLSGGGGGGSAPWDNNNGAGGGGAGTLCVIVDLLRIKGHKDRLYRFVLGSPAGYSGSSFGTSGKSGNTSYMYDDYRAGSSTISTKVADATGGKGGSSSRGGKGGVAHIYSGLKDYVWFIHGINYGSAANNYAHGEGGDGGAGGIAGSKGTQLIWAAYAMLDKDLEVAGDGCSIGRLGGTSGQNISGGGGASLWGNGANGVGGIGTKGARGTNGSGGSGARWTVGGKEGGPGGYSYLRICWTGSTPSAPSAIYPAQLNAPSCSIVSSSTSSSGYIEKKISIQNTNTVPVDVIVQGNKQGVTLQPYSVHYVTLPSHYGTASIRLYRVEGDYKASNYASVSLA